MSAIPVVGTAAGTAIAAKGALTQGEMTSQSLQAQAQQQEVQATEARQQGEFNAERSQIIAGARIGESTAAYGASGVESTSGSVGAVMRAGAENAELDRMNILHGADIKAVNYQNQASLDRYGAESAIKGSYFNALAAVFGGASNIGQQTIGAGSSSGVPSGGGEGALSMTPNPGAEGATVSGMNASAEEAAAIA